MYYSKIYWQTNLIDSGCTSDVYSYQDPVYIPTCLKGTEILAGDYYADYPKFDLCAFLYDYGPVWLNNQMFHNLKITAKLLFW